MRQSFTCLKAHSIFNPKSLALDVWCCVCFFVVLCCVLVLSYWILLFVLFVLFYFAYRSVLTLYRVQLLLFLVVSCCVFLVYLYFLQLYFVLYCVVLRGIFGLSRAISILFCVDFCHAFLSMELSRDIRIIYSVCLFSTRAVSLCNIAALSFTQLLTSCLVLFCVVFRDVHVMSRVILFVLRVALCRLLWCTRVVLYCIVVLCSFSDYYQIND